MGAAEETETKCCTARLAWIRLGGRRRQTYCFCRFRYTSVTPSAGPVIGSGTGTRSQLDVRVSSACRHVDFVSFFTILYNNNRRGWSTPTGVVLYRIDYRG
jgi:hypothetical protein